MNLKVSSEERYNPVLRVVISRDLILVKVWQESHFCDFLGEIREIGNSMIYHMLRKLKFIENPVPFNT